jgi:hypothetical protein
MYGQEEKFTYIFARDRIFVDNDGVPCLKTMCLHKFS